MSKFHNALWVCGLLSLAAIMEGIRIKFNIPVSLGDLLFSPISIVGSYVILRYELLNKKALSQHNMGAPITITKRLSILAVGILLIGLGAWSVWLGCEEPMVYRSGCRGALHGYSMVPLGIFIFLVGVLMSIKMIYPRRIKT